MAHVLSAATVFVNLVATIVSLWLGLYIVTHSVRWPVAWLSALTVWLVATWFLYNALRIYPLDADAWYALGWLAQTVKYAVPVLLHFSYMLRREVAPLHPSARLVNLGALALGYILVTAQIADSVRYMTLQPALSADISRLDFGAPLNPPTYPLFFCLLVTLPLLALFNLYQARQVMRSSLLKRQIGYVMWAVGIAYLGSVMAGTGIMLVLGMPTLPSALIVAIGIFLLGYGVARYHALIEGRPMRRDTLYSILGMVIVTAFYGLLLLGLYLYDQATFTTVALVLVGAVITHGLFESGRIFVERLVFRGRFRKLRADLRLLSKEAGTGRNLSDQLNTILRTLLHDLHVSQGFIALRHNDHFVVESALGRQWLAQTFPLAALSTTTMRELTAADQAALPQMAWLIPLSANGEQIAALVLGATKHGHDYRPHELEHLDTLAENLADMIHITQQQEEQAQELDRQVSEFRARERALQHQLQEILSPTVPDEEELSSLVEDALRRLDDYGYLGEHALAKLGVVEQTVTDRDDSNTDDGSMPITHVDQGKALQQVLIQTITILRPDGDEPTRSEVPSREWQPFVILHDHYVRGEMVRDIMSRLYISERTYHRRRKAGIQSVAKSLSEMEEHSKGATPAGQHSFVMEQISA